LDPLGNGCVRRSEDAVTGASIFDNSLCLLAVASSGVVCSLIGLCNEKRGTSDVRRGVDLRLALTWTVHGKASMQRCYQIQEAYGRSYGIQLMNLANRKQSRSCRQLPPVDIPLRDPVREPPRSRQDPFDIPPPRALTATLGYPKNCFAKRDRASSWTVQLIRGRPH
jgi:hypothetical protein